MSRARRGWDAHEWTAAAGTRVHAAVMGPADVPAAVLVHGLGCSHRYFRPLAKVLSPDLRSVAVDLPGFGLTRGPREALDVRGLSLALAGWLRATGRGGAVLVGNSVGCQVLVDLAVHSPELLGPLVLNGPTTDARARTPLRQAGRLALDAPMERPDLGMVLALDYVSSGVRRAAGTFSAVLHDPVERKAPLVHVPAVVVRGRLDPVVSHAWARELTDLMPQGRLIEVPFGGHTLNWSRPRVLARVVRSLVAEERAPHSAGAAIPAPAFQAA
jgi:pimeloyl-ACP methyl ester carboxylesterase